MKDTETVIQLKGNIYGWTDEVPDEIVTGIRMIVKNHKTTETLIEVRNQTAKTLGKAKARAKIFSTC